MWKKKRVKPENTAAAVPGIPRPQPQMVHNHGPNWTGLAVVGFICLIILLYIIWHFLLYVVEETTGARNPVKAVGEGGAWLIGALIAAWVISKIIKIVIDWDLERNRIKAHADIESTRNIALTAGAPTPVSSRLTGEQKRLCENLALVMRKAYQDLADSQEVGYQGGSDMRPWSKRAVLAMDPPRYGKMPDSKATDIRRWLAERGVIVGDPQNDQVNTALYPTFADFQALLHGEFELPVVMRTRKALPSPASSGYMVMDI